jgi:manganese transport protein
MQLSFAVVPLVMFTGSKGKMEGFVNPRWLKLLAWLISLIIIGLNLYLLYNTLLP